MGPLLVGGQPRADALSHDQHDRSVAEAEPIGPPDQLVVAVAYERILFAAIQRRLVKLGHLDILPVSQRRRADRVPLEPCLPGCKPARRKAAAMAPPTAAGATGAAIV